MFDLFLSVNNRHRKEMLMLILERLFLVYLIDETDLIYDDHPIHKRLQIFIFIKFEFTSVSLSHRGEDFGL